jgi:hypothetical protein
VKVETEKMDTIMTHVVLEELLQGVTGFYTSNYTTMKQDVLVELVQGVTGSYSSNVFGDM